MEIKKICFCHWNDCKFFPETLKALIIFHVYSMFLKLVLLLQSTGKMIFIFYVQFPFFYFKRKFAFWEKLPPVNWTFWYNSPISNAWKILSFNRFSVHFFSKIIYNRLLYYYFKWFSIIKQKKPGNLCYAYNSLHF